MVKNRRVVGMNALLTGSMVLVAVALGCSQEGAAELAVDGAAEDAFSELGMDLYLDGLTWPNGEVRVCYDTDGNNPTLIAETKRQLAASWSRAANITFTDWGPCNLTPRPTGHYSTIVLHFCGGSSTSSNCPATGYDHNVRAAGAFRGYSTRGRVNFTGNISGNLTPGQTQMALISDDADPFMTRFRYQVIHEFGHALGYRHEQDRPDNFDNMGNTIYCNESAQEATTGSSQTSFFDLPSILDYCSTDPLTGGNFPNAMSHGDILGVRVAYDRNTATRGFMIKSDRNSGLAVNAWGGAAEGSPVKLHQSCTDSNPDCTWTYQRGLLVSDKDPTLAIYPLGGAADNHNLVLTRSCTSNNLADNPDCTWTYRDGVFYNDRDPSLALSAPGGSAHGKALVTNAGCDKSNPDCTWTLPDVMFSSNRNPGVAINAVNGAANDVALGLHRGCTPANADCTFTFSKGMLSSTSDSSLKVTAAGGATNNAVVEVNNRCTSTNKDCRWTWTKGRLISDNTTNGTLSINAVGGGIHGAELKLASTCTPTNPDCVFSGMVAK